MKLLFEHVKIAPDRSWRGLHRNLRAIPFEWHFHPEYELTLTLGSEGQRYVGDHIGSYGDDDLVLLGPNLPHTWHSHNAAPPASGKIDMGAYDLDLQAKPGERPHQAFVFWFTADWINNVCETIPEFARLRPVLTDARRGVKFDTLSARKVAAFTHRFDIGDPADRLLCWMRRNGYRLRPNGLTRRCPIIMRQPGLVGFWIFCIRTMSNKPEVLKLPSRPA
jgi:hypothetical protein